MAVDLADVLAEVDTLQITVARRSIRGPLLKVAIAAPLITMCLFYALNPDDIVFSRDHALASVFFLVAWLGTALFTSAALWHIFPLLRLGPVLVFSPSGFIDRRAMRAPITWTNVESIRSSTRWNQRVMVFDLTTTPDDNTLTLLERCHRLLAAGYAGPQLAVTAFGTNWTHDRLATVAIAYASAHNGRQR